MRVTAPKRRTSHSKKNKRRGHDALVPVNPTICSKCSEPVMPHRICSHCGFYRGRQMIAPLGRGCRNVEAGVRGLTESCTGIMMTLYRSWIGVAQ